MYNVACVEEKKNAHRLLVGKKPDVKRPLGRPSCRCQDGTVWTGVICVGQGQTVGSSKPL